MTDKLDDYLLTEDEIADNMPAGELQIDQKFAFAQVIAKAQLAKVCDAGWKSPERRVNV